MRKINTSYVLPHKRRAEKKTNYQKRYRLLLSGKDRVVIRKTNTKFIVHISKYMESDEISHSTDSSELRKYGWECNTKNTPSAYLTGYLCGKKISNDKKIKEVVPDFGLFKPKRGSGIFAVLKGLKDSGISFQLKDDILPEDKRITGEHIETYAKTGKSDNFGKTRKSSSEITKEFGKVKKKIDEAFK